MGTWSVGLVGSSGLNYGVTWDWNKTTLDAFAAHQLDLIPSVAIPGDTTQPPAPPRPPNLSDFTYREEDRNGYGYGDEYIDWDGYYAAIYRHSLIEGPFRAAGIAVTPIPQDHGSIPSLGFRFGRFAYANDVVELPDEAFEVMAGVEVLVVDAMRYRPHPTHAHLERTLGWIERIGPQRAFLTNLHVDMDYAELDRHTPDNVHPCHDGQAIDINGE